MWREESGQAMVEYALILGLIMLACVAVFGSLGSAIKNLYPNDLF